MNVSKKDMSGYPSEERPWLKYYKENAEDEANEIPNDKTVWDVIEESLYKHIDIPALEYFGRKITRKELIDNVYTWARTFKALGVDENEIVAYYGPFLPEVCYMIFALNIIGACPYFLKLAISPEALAEETKECRIAIVFDQMWPNVSAEFSKDKFEKIIIIRIEDSMPAIKKQIVSVLSGIKNKISIPKTKKYIIAHKAVKLSNDFVGEVRVKFVKDRNTFITSSSGTTVNGTVKGVIATNESVIAQLLSTIKSDTPYRPGDRTLNHFPPTASTSLNSLCFVGLFSGATIIIDPRVSETDFYNQLIKLKPSMCINTGSLWETFFNRVSREINEGCKFDFSYARGWMIGGEGTSVKKMKKWNLIMQECGGKGIYGGYGCSETFSGICIDRINQRCDYKKPVVGIGVPQAGMVVGIFDDNDKELQFNQRGELRVKTKASMKGYYNKPELTAEVKVDGWIHTGDLAEIDENGFVYIYGRISDSIELPDGREVYLFDLANKMKEFDYIKDAVVLKKPVKNEPLNLIAHIVWSDGVKEEEKTEHLIELTQSIVQFEPEVTLNTYAFHKDMLPYSPTTLKIDKNKMSNQNDNYVRVFGTEIEAFSFC